MLLTHPDGSGRLMPVHAALYGLTIVGVTFDAADLSKLLCLPEGELRAYLLVLHTRFAPTKPEEN